MCSPQLSHPWVSLKPYRAHLSFRPLLCALTLAFLSECPACEIFPRLLPLGVQCTKKPRKLEVCKYIWEARFMDARHLPWSPGPFQGVVGAAQTASSGALVQLGNSSTWKTVFARESNAVGGLAREWRHSPQGRVTHLQDRLPSYSRSQHVLKGQPY